MEWQRLLITAGILILLETGCTFIYMSVQGNLSTDNININKTEDIKPDTKADVHVIP